MSGKYTQSNNATVLELVTLYEHDFTYNFDSERVSDLLCMSNLAHASKLKEHDDNDDIQGSIRRSAERR